MSGRGLRNLTIRSVARMLPERPAADELLAADIALDDVALQLEADFLRAFAVHGDQPGAALGQRFDHRDGNALVGAMLDHLGFGHREIEGAAHDWPRMAAARR